MGRNATTQNNLTACRNEDSWATFERRTPRNVPPAGHDGSAKAQYDGIKTFSETDFTDGLTTINVPTLVMHCDDDQIVPIADSALLSAKLLKKRKLKV